MQKLKPREWILILVPLMMAVAALVWQFKPDITRVMSPRLYVESTRFVPVTPYEVSRGYDTKLEVVLNHGWPRPKWWTEFEGYGISDELRVYEANADLPVRSAMRSLYWAPMYHGIKDRYVTEFLFCLSKVKNTNALFLKKNIVIENDTTSAKLASLPIKHLVRRQNVKTWMPVVSRQTGLRVRRVIIAPRNRSRPLPGKIWMRVVYQREKGVAPLPNDFGADLGSRFINSKGQDLMPFKFPIGGLASAQREDAFKESSFDPSLNDIGSKVTRADQWYYEDFGFDFPTTRSTIFYEQKFSFGDLWPMQFKAEMWNDAIRKNFRAGRASDATFTQSAITPPV